MKIKISPLAAAFAVVTLLAASAASAATVAKDPVTGELRAPTASEAQALSQPASSGRVGVKAASTSTQARGLLTGRINPQPVQHADGSVEHELDESSLSFSVATRNSDGSISQACVTGAQAADAAMKAPAKTNAKTAKGHSHDLK
ncbi:hypothetical protein LNV09_05825 [Paucibacter sp. B2R-40]|uniref:post-PEP-CTERM-1 domain-containing protein n=1 Tax=Paucibacter sp. B2R-40 TaxID=2893554 RepID=UPI0021E35D89|nr:hypothetical protein [Paucibacter sp. B2R-40]MCV2353679.1 hypothetical protein [Paucibacter sp. B2R-40]